MDKFLLERKKLLIRLLKENNCYHQFTVYMNSDKLYKVKDKSVDNLDKLIKYSVMKNYNEVFLAFNWNNSKEGLNYWFSILQKWEKICKLKWDKIINYEQHR